MEVFIKDEDKNKYESFALSGYYHTVRLGEEDTGKKNCLIQDFWSDDCEELPKLLVKPLDQHDTEVRADERKKVLEEIESWYITAKERCYDANMWGMLKELQDKLTEIKERK